jgi:hypothetical protein
METLRKELPHALDCFSNFNFTLSGQTTTVTLFKTCNFTIKIVAHTHSLPITSHSFPSMAVVAITTGADFLKVEPLNGNLRRINSSSEETAVDIDEDIAVASDKENGNFIEVSVIGRSVIRHNIIDLDKSTRDRMTQAPPTFDLSPRVVLAQAIDTATFLSMMLYLGKLGSNIPAAVAAGQSGVWPTLFVIAKSLNYCKSF